TTVAYRWPFWIANSSIASSRTPSRFGGPSERSRCRKSIALTVFQSSPNHRAVCRTDVPAHSRATLSASRRVTRAWGSSQSSRSSLGPQRGQARRSRGTHNSTAYSNSGRSRIRRTVWSWMAATGWSQPEQRRFAPSTGQFQHRPGLAAPILLTPIPYAITLPATQLGHTIHFGHGRPRFVASRTTILPDRKSVV